MTSDELAAFSERTAVVLAGGGGLKALAQLLADTTHGAVLVEDDQWRHIALVESRGGVGSLPPSFAPFFAEAQRDQRSNGVARATIASGVHALCAPMPGQSDSNGGVGYVTLFLRAKASHDAVTLLRIVASAAAIESLRRGSSRGQAKRAFWERCVGGQFQDGADLKKEAHAAGVTLAASYLAAVFDPESSAGSARRQETLLRALASADAFAPIPSTGAQLAVLFPIRHQIDVTRARQAATNALRQANEGLDAPAVSCGIGAFHADIVEVPVSIAEARQAHALGRRLFGAGTVAVYPELGVYALLHAGADRGSFQRFSARMLDPLAAYDRKHKTDLLRTLQLYFDVGENVKEAAERLSVHRHTIFYRLNQIAQILKVDLKSPKDQLSLRAALAIRLMDAQEDAHE